ncbi:MAG: hypothetical protein BGO32_08655 [Bacteroidetes bacterium 37-13]|nr:MAG: hypothetical protein BGO32_08655 [Bacteroidetes bacterium 37-13]
MSTKAIADNFIAFSFGDLATTFVLLFVTNDWFIAVETIALKMFVIIFSGFIGGAAGLLGKHLMQKWIDKNSLNVILVASFCLAIAGCSPKVAGTVSNSTTNTIDSTGVWFTERLVPVYLPGDTLVFYAEVECPDAQESSAKIQEASKAKPFKQQSSGKRSNGSIELDNKGKLTAVLTCDAWKDSVKVRDTEITRLKSTIKTDSTTHTVMVRYVPKAYKAAMWFSWIIIALIVLWAGLKVAKLYFKIQMPF